MTNKTTLQAAADALVIRDAAGTYYVLTDRVLHEARATTEQRTVLVFGCGDQRTIGLIANDVRDREPFQVIGVAALPLPAGTENPFWPGIFEERDGRGKESLR